MVEQIINKKEEEESPPDLNKMATGDDEDGFKEGSIQANNPSLSNIDDKSNGSLKELNKQHRSSH